MKNVQVITDSTSDLSEELIKKYNIEVIPLYVIFGEDTYKDGQELTTEDLYKKVEEFGELPKTSAPTPNDFQKVFENHINADKSIIYIGLSSQLSTTLQNAKIAASEFPEGKIQIVDSFNLSAGIALLALKAVDLAKEGLDVKEIACRLREQIPKSRTYFAIDTLEYLHKGGRCSSVQSFLSNMLKIRPILKVTDGKILLHKKTRGKREKMLNVLLKDIFIEKKDLDLNRMVVIHSLAYEDGEYLKKELQETLDVKEIIFLKAGCVISSHCGPKTVGIMCLTK
ncbi:MAG: DegV family protein [Clostridiaceae bacterium]|nr:DegV family protein [Clostridiaceae bacterium]